MAPAVGPRGAQAVAPDGRSNERRISPIVVTPLRGWLLLLSLRPTARAVGYILSPLRGWIRRGLLPDRDLRHRHDHAFVLEQVEPQQCGADGRGALRVE